MEIQISKLQTGRAAGYFQVVICMRNTFTWQGHETTNYEQAPQLKGDFTKAFGTCWTAQHTHTQKLRPSGLLFWKKGKYVAEADTKYFDHRNVYNFETDWESTMGRLLHFTHVTKNTPPNKNKIETTGKNTPAETDELERKCTVILKRWSSQAEHNTERAIQSKETLKELRIFFLPQSKGNLLGDLSCFSSKGCILHTLPFSLTDLCLFSIKPYVNLKTLSPTRVIFSCIVQCTPHKSSSQARHCI